MPSPYREREIITAPAPLAELEWRRRVGKSALWAVRLLLGEVALLLASQWLPAHLAAAEVVASLVLGAGATVATWKYTAARPGSGVDLLDWLLRVGVPAYLFLAALLLHGMHLVTASYVLGGVLAVAVSGYAALATRPPRRVRGWRADIKSMVFAAAALVIGPYLLKEPAWRGFALAFIAYAALAPAVLRRALLPVDHEWWFDARMEAPGEWIALLVYRNKQVELLRVDEKLGLFPTRDDATAWLRSEGYVPAERALEEHLVDSVPQHVLPRTRRQRVRDSKPRLRVAADAPRADEVDPGALDKAEPRRAVHKPDE